MFGGFPWFCLLNPNFSIYAGVTAYDAMHGQCPGGPITVSYIDVGSGQSIYHMCTYTDYNNIRYLDYYKVDSISSQKINV